MQLRLKHVLFEIGWLEPQDCGHVLADAKSFVAASSATQTETPLLRQQHGGTGAKVSEVDKGEIPRVTFL